MTRQFFMMHLKKDNAWRAKRRWRGENIYIKNTAVTHRHVMLRQKYVACPALAIDTTEGVKKTPQCQCQQYIFGIGVCLLGPLHGGLWLVSSSEGGWFKVSRLLSSLWWIWFLCSYPADPAVMPEKKIYSRSPAWRQTSTRNGLNLYCQSPGFSIFIKTADVKF